MQTTNMPANSSTITRHLPLITERIEFFPSKHFGAPPIITPRIDFASTTCSHFNGDTDSITEDDSTSVLTPLTETEVLNNSASTEEDEDIVLVASELKGTLIAKPKGQPGRPESGGYNLTAKLTGWRPQLLNAVTVSFEPFSE